MIYYLIFVNLQGQQIDGQYVYEFTFNTSKRIEYNEEINLSPCGLCENLNIKGIGKTLIKHIISPIKLDVIQENCCFGFTHCMDGVVSLAHENIDEYDEYPDDGRLVLMYGEKYDDVIKKLAEKNILLEE